MAGVVDGEWGHFLHVEPVDVLLKEAEQRQVQRGHPGLLALQDRWRCQRSPSGCHTRQTKRVEGAYFGGVAVVEGVLDHQALQHLDGDLTDLPELLQGCVHLPEQQPHQEVVPAEVVRERVIQLEVCREEEEEEEEERHEDCVQWR